MFPTIGLWELLAILAIAVLVFGAKRLPEIGSGLARGIKSFRQGIREDEEESKKGGEIAEKAPEEKGS
ncbi:MAG: twin-arginine translocase TatA/TatE family subunit [Nitrospinota bacterium]